MFGKYSNKIYSNTLLQKKARDTVKHMNNLEKWKTRQKLESNNLSVVQIQALKIKLKLN